MSRLLEKYHSAMINRCLKNIRFPAAVCRRPDIEATSTQSIMFLPLFHRAPNPPGNKQKISVRTHEPPGRDPRRLRPDTLMPTGVPVMESCKRSSKTRWLVSHDSAQGVADEYERCCSAHVEPESVSTSYFVE